MKTSSPQWKQIRAVLQLVGASAWIFTAIAVLVLPVIEGVLINLTCPHG